MTRSSRGSSRTMPRCRCASAAGGTTRATRPAATTRSMRGARTAPASMRPRSQARTPPAICRRAGAARRKRDGAGQRTTSMSPSTRSRPTTGSWPGPTTNGRRQYDIRFKTSTPARSIPMIHGAAEYTAWADDNRTPVLRRERPDTLLTKRTKKHVLGTDPGRRPDRLRGADDSFYMGVGARATTSTSSSTSAPPR